MTSTTAEIQQERLNPKFEPLPGEFVYKNTYWVQWSSLKIIQQIENDFQFYPDDVLISTYPKSGTTLLQELVWLIQNNGDIKEAQNHRIFHRCPFIDENYSHDFTEFDFSGYIVDGAHKIPRPRLMKTHLGFRNLGNQINNNPEMKILVILRNPRDNAVSMYHFYKGIIDYGPYKGTWSEFFERWIDGWIGGGDWLDVVTEWWNERHRKNVKVVLFEDLIYKKKEVVGELCQFLNKQFSDDIFDEMIRHTEFKKMKENSSTNYSLMGLFGFGEDFNFMRKGEVGDWKNYFTEDQIKRCDNKYNAALERIGLKFQYE